MTVFFLLQVEIMSDIFGDSLIRAPADGAAPKIETLPSPEDLKRKILLKVTIPYMQLLPP